MLGKIKYGKIAIVVFLTVLIWVWADLALDETPPARPAVIVVEESADQKLWVSFSQARSVDIKVTLSGPHSAFNALERKLPLHDKRLRFVFDAVRENMNEPPGDSLKLLGFLQKDEQLRRLGLKVTSCEPEVVDVNVVGLVKKTLTVECFDQDGVPVKAQSIEPDKVEMFAPESTRTARVRLSRREIEQARLTPIEKVPYIVLALDQYRLAFTPVNIKIPLEQNRLTDHNITATTPSIALSQALLAEYSVEITNLRQILSSPIVIRATDEAKWAYEHQTLPLMTLYIFDDDARKAEEELRSRAVEYNFPPEFVRRGEIKLKNPDQPAEAKFRLIRRASAEKPPGGVD